MNITNEACAHMYIEYRRIAAHKDGRYHDEWKCQDCGKPFVPYIETPNSALPPLAPEIPKRKMLIEIEVAETFEDRLDNQWMVEREIQADRWTWHWACTVCNKPSKGFLCDEHEFEFQTSMFR